MITTGLSTWFPTPVRVTLTFDRFGCFPDLNRPRILWIGSSREPPLIASIYEALNNALIPLGFSRPSEILIPHLTLARLTARPDPETLNDIDAPGFLPPWEGSFTALTLYQSTLTPQGSEYTALASVPLA